MPAELPDYIYFSALYKNLNLFTPLKVDLAGS